MNIRNFNLLNKQPNQEESRERKPLRNVYQAKRIFKENEEPTFYQVQLRVNRIKSYYKSQEESIDFSTVKKIQEEISKVKQLIEELDSEIDIEELIFQEI